MERKITVIGVIQEGIGIGLKNALSLVGAVVLWLLTIWIPYINVGTTIAICTIPVALSKGKVVSPLFIFESKYRQYMGEFFTLMGLMFLSLFPAFLFGIIPAYIIAIGWSLAIYILLDKGVAPGEALVQSNKATHGYKWTIFGVGIVLALAVFILAAILSRLGVIGNLLCIILFVCYPVISLGCSTVIYRNLFLNVNIDEIKETPLAPLMED